MAGAGFKTFNTGDVLTSSDVNTYLMQQTVMVFDDATARSTALPTPSEGMFSYLKDTNLTYRYDGSAWLSDAGTTSPLTTKGDVWGYSTTDARIPVGANGTVLTADSGEALGLKWATPAAGGMTSLASGSLSGTSLDLQSISASYNQLTLILRDFSVSGSAAMNFTVNNTTGIYAYDNASSSDGSVNDTNSALFGGNNVDPIDYNNYLQIDLFDYANTTSHKYGNTRYFIRVAGDVYYGGWTYNLIRTTNAIDRITVNVGSAETFDVGTYTLFGVK